MSYYHLIWTPQFVNKLEVLTEKIVFYAYSFIHEKHYGKIPINTNFFTIVVSHQIYCKL